MVFLAAGLFGSRFLGAAFVFGIAFEIDAFGEAFESFGEKRWRDALIMFPRGGIDCDVHAGLSQNDIADEMLVRQFVVDLLFAVGETQSRLHDRVGIPREDRHREREQSGLGIAQGFDFAAQDIGQCLKRPFDGPAQTVGFGDALRTHLDRQVGQQVDLTVAGLSGRVELQRDAADLQFGLLARGGVDVGEDQRLFVQRAGLTAAHLSTAALKAVRPGL